MGDLRPWREPVKAHTISGSVRNLEANGKISGKIDALGSAFKKMSNTRIKSCKESAKRINSEMWTKPTQKSLKPEGVFTVKPPRTCTRGTRNLDDHTMS